MCTVECKTVHPPLLLTGGGGYDLYDLKKKKSEKDQTKDLQLSSFGSMPCSLRFSLVILL